MEVFPVPCKIFSKTHVCLSCLDQVLPIDLVDSPMRKSLFSHTFRYRRTDKYTPKENYLSEIIAYIINFMPLKESNQLVEKAFIPGSLQPQFRALINNHKVEALTQFRTADTKILDLVIMAYNKPIIVIENKIDAIFQSHSVSDEESGEAEHQQEHHTQHQLVTYGRWLQDADRPSDWPGVLTLLTHTVLAPSDFLGEAITRYSSVPHLCYWRNLHAELRKIMGYEECLHKTVAWQFLGQELCRFLEENNMDSSDISSVDIASLNVAMMPSRKAAVCFQEIGAELLRGHPEYFVPGGQSHEFNSEKSMSWGWTYFEGGEKIYVGYGILFPPLVGVMEQANPTLPDQEHAVIIVGCDKTAIQTPSFQFPDGWSRLEDDYWLLKLVPLNSRNTGERFPQFLLRTIEDNFDAIIALRNGYRPK